MKVSFFKTKKPKQRIVTQKVTKLSNQILPYTLTVSRLAKHLRMKISRDAKLSITIPYGLREEKVESFIQEKSDWILLKLAYFKSLPQLPSRGDTEKEYRKLKDEALVFVQTKIIQLNMHYTFSYNQIRIKNHKTLWGSCSRKNNLNFNYKIIQLPIPLAEYIIVHELCHLKEFNHSKRFWDLVAVAIPDHKARRWELRTTGRTTQ